MRLAADGMRLATTDFSDLGSLLNNYGSSAAAALPPALQIVPEPSSMIVWATLGVLAFSEYCMWRLLRMTSGRLQVAYAHR